jgi:predicted enzyme related to lactoylglutathione lyase
MQGIAAKAYDAGEAVETESMSNTLESRARYSHSGICVSNLQRSTKFYKNVFGFIDGISIEIENAHQNLLGMPGEVHLRSFFLRLDGLVIELLHFDPPAAFGSATPREMNQRGLTHLSFNVDNLDSSLRDVVTWGGSVLDSTRTCFTLPEQKGEIIFVADPDGTRIELMAFPADVVNA